MHGRHGRQLVGQSPAHRGIDGLVVHEAGVHEPEAVEQARRSHWNQLDGQTGAGDQGDAVSGPRVVVAVAGEQPHQARDQRRAVDDGVVAVARLHKQRIRQGGVLNGDLAGQVKGPLDVPNPPAPLHGSGHLHQREHPRQLPDGVEAHDH